MVDLRLLDRLAGRRQGLTTTGGLLELGFTYDDIKWLVGRGILIRVRRGVYRMVGAPLTQEQAYLAAVMASGELAVLSHLSAVNVWRFRGFPNPAGIDVLREGATRPKGPGIRGHKTIWLPPHDRTTLWGIPITTPARTFFDVCAAVPPRVLARAGDDLIRQKRLTDKDLRRTLDSIPVSGRRAVRPAIAYLKGRPIGLELSANDRELDVLRVLRDAGITPLPQQQVRVRVGGRTYKVDYGWAAIREGFEYVGFDPHGNLYSQFHDDADRTRNLQRAGWTLWPVTALTTEDEIIDIARELVATLAA
jgi:hypothetical protein